MSDLYNILSNRLYLVAGITYLFWILFCWIFVGYFNQFVGKLVRKTESRIDDVLLREAKLPLWLTLIVLGFFVVSKTVGLPNQVALRVERITGLTIVFVLIYFIARLLLNMAKLAAEKNAGIRNIMPTFSRLANLVVWGTGLLMLMDIFGISVTPVLASLGIAGLAVGLALQDTLSNFFAGIYISVSQPVRLGDYIQLENGLNGYITNIGWRETRIKTLPNNMVIVPNSKLSQSIVTNYYLPQAEMACLVQVGVSYDSDLAKVEKVTVEVGREVLQKVSGGVKSFEPFIRYHTFADFSINFTVILRVLEFTDKYLVTHEFIKALHQRYKQEGIQIPFPIRDINIKKSG
ncbi:MAG: mechanosensitive ion channel family protein [bacterium]